MITGIVLVILIPAGLVFGVFLRALSARLMTGKWPHEDEVAKAIFDKLP